jgi:sugar phosphate isomerase/epimerase
LQHHAPLQRHWQDCYDLVSEVNSPRLQMCLDLPILERQDAEYVREAAKTVGARQVFCHFGGELVRDGDGRVRQKRLYFDRPVPDYTYFMRLMREIGYDYYMSFELCHPVVDERHRRCGLDYVHQQVQLAREFMSQTIEESLA